MRLDLGSQYSSIGLEASTKAGLQQASEKWSAHLQSDSGRTRREPARFFRSSVEHQSGITPAALRRLKPVGGGFSQGP